LKAAFKFGYTRAVPKQGGLSLAGAIKHQLLVKVRINIRANKLVDYSTLLNIFANLAVSMLLEVGKLKISVSMHYCQEI
jgi:hypothetical protein